MKFHKIWRHPNIMSIMRHRDCHNMLRAKVSWSRVHVAWIQRCPAWQTKRNWPTNTNCLKSNDIHRCWHPLIWNLHVPCQHSTRSHVFFDPLKQNRQVADKSNVNQMSRFRQRHWNDSKRQLEHLKVGVRFCLFNAMAPRNPNSLHW